MGVSATPSPDQRQIRVFLSSTFVDFLEERELLSKRVFPALNRRARDRGVDLVDVDLRWGVTEEQTKQGQTLPLCLGEIDRCRPYFIGLLGERHGWVPPAEFYRPELLERQPWLEQHQGGASVTELEIMHGVLRNPEMAGYARFYLRDPAYALAQQDPAWLAQSEAERQRLESLKQQVRDSGFPVVEGLGDPEAIASRIEADLWQLIEQRFPEQEPPDALAREERKHANYRQARLGVYLDAAGHVQKLKDLIDSGEQQILITGDLSSPPSAPSRQHSIASGVSISPGRFVVHTPRKPAENSFCRSTPCSDCLRRRANQQKSSSSPLGQIEGTWPRAARAAKAEARRSAAFDAVAAGAEPSHRAGIAGFLDRLTLVSRAADAVVAGGVEAKGAAVARFLKGAAGVAAGAGNAVAA